MFNFKFSFAKVTYASRQRTKHYWETQNLQKSRTNKLPAVLFPVLFHTGAACLIINIP